MYSSSLTHQRTLQRQFLKEMQSGECDSWLKGATILQKILTNQPQLSTSFKSDIRLAIRHTNSLMMLLLIYSYNIRSAYQSYYTSPYKDQFITLRRHEDCYLSIESWLDSQSDQIKQTAVQLILQNLPQLLLKEKQDPNPEDIQFILAQFNRLTIKRERDVNTAITLMGRLQKLQIYEKGRVIQNKSMAIIHLTCQILRSSEGKGNLALVFDEHLLESPSKYSHSPSKVYNCNNIDRFCNIFSQYMLELTAQELTNIFKGLTKTSITLCTLDFVHRASRLLAHQEEFFKLCHLYEKFILPHLVRRAKTCKKPNLDQKVVSICQFYLIGFNSYYKYGKSALQCLLDNVELVKNEIVQARWVSLCRQAAQKSLNRQIISYVQKHLQSKKLKNIILPQKDLLLVATENEAWQITARSVRQLKPYKMVRSHYKGIVNHSAQCYIISIVQALFMTTSLRPLLKQARPRTYGKRIIDHLYNLFDTLEDHTTSIPSVTQLKSDGPKDFAQSQQQQDAQNYLIELMQQLEIQLKKQNLVKKFKQTYQIQTRHTIDCPHCGYRTDDIQHEYSHTIAHGEEFSLQRKETLMDYKCSKCGKDQCTQTTTITLNSTIFIVHINRFSSKRGNTKKELPTQTIQRKIGTYELVGMVFHYGRTMQNGHYVYYTRLDKKKWAEMNDKIVNQFDLDDPNEEFQKEFKAEKTPYILFYKKAK